MFTIYEYDRLFPAAENCLSYVVAERQPLAGGYADDEEGRTDSARILVPVDTCETLDEARVKIRARILAVAGPAYSDITERPAYQGMLAITAALPEEA